jgi:hypothetical protein
MNALDLIRRIESLGGRIELESDGLRLHASTPLPDELVEAVGKQKVAIMLALGAPLNTAITSALAEVRPYLSPSLRRLSDDRLLILVNWSIMSAFDRAVVEVSRR